MKLTQFLKRLVERGILSLESAEVIQVASKKDPSSSCMVCLALKRKGLRRESKAAMKGDYLCGGHSRLKATNQKKFWQLVIDVEAQIPWTEKK